MRVSTLARNAFRATALLILVANILEAQRTAAKVDSTALYHQLLARLNAGDTTLDFTALRLSYAASPDYEPMPNIPDDLKSTLLAALQARDAAKATRMADSLVALEPLDAGAYILRAAARRAAGDSAGGRRDVAIAHGLIQSVLDSGDGTQARPWVVIAVAEEYAVLRWKRLHVDRQGLVTCGAHPCDAMSVSGQSPGAPSEYYFDVSMSMGFLERVLKN